MADTIENIGSSLLHYGPENNRIYIMKYSEKDRDDVDEKITELLAKYNFSKIFAKIPKKFSKYFEDLGYEKEAEIPKFFSGEEDVIFFSKFIDPKRKKLENKEELDNVIEVCKNKKPVSDFKLKSDKFTMRKTTEKDAEAMAILYKKVFPSYPFPIFDPNYLIETMRDNIIYYGIWENDKLVSLASAEMDLKSKNSEMTDFATLPEYRGHGFALTLLHALEEEIKPLGIKTLYTIARAKSFGMNITFKKSNYTFSGVLKNNTNISGDIESMNVWYKV